MALTNEEILNAVAEKTVLELVELISAFEEKFNVSAAAVAVAAPAGGAAAAAEEQSEFNVELTSFGANKVAVIKAVREATGLGLKEAKDLVEGAPQVLKANSEFTTAVCKHTQDVGFDTIIVCNHMVF